MGEAGIFLDASYAPHIEDNPTGQTFRSPFFWSNGVFEVPVSCLLNFNRHSFVDYDFNSPALLSGSPERCVQQHEAYLNSFFARYGNQAIAVLTICPWYFYSPDENGYYSIFQPDSVNKLNLVLEMLSKKYDIVTLGDIAASLHEERQRAIPEYVELGQSEPYCTICRAPASHFTNLNDVPKRHCPVCKSLERQRVFYDLYTKGVFGKGALGDKKILHIAPSIVERRIFSEINCYTVSIDIRPDFKPDILGNISNIPQIPDESFDIVFGSFVFTCTENFQDAVKELWRILRPGGFILCHDPLREGVTKEIREHEEIVAYYGGEAYQKYHVGTFRIFGEEDYASKFSPYFNAELYYGIDTPTGIRQGWLKAVKPAPPSKASLIASCIKDIPVKASQRSARKVVITIDTEAHKLRAERDHVRRLIWGEHNGDQYGLGRMMDIAEAHNVQFTSFLDLPEYTSYGEDILDVGREVLRRGHDLQVHMHPEMFSREFFDMHGLRSESYVLPRVSNLSVAEHVKRGRCAWDPTLSSRDHIRCYIDTTLDIYSRITPVPPSAFRTMGFKLTPALIELLGETSIPLSSNYNPQFPDRAPFLKGVILPPFYWHTGMLELPVSCLMFVGAKGPEHYNFNTSLLLGGDAGECARRHEAFLNCFFDSNPQNTVAVMVMHSWSFLIMDKKGFFTIPNEHAVEVFDTVLSRLSKQFEFITLKEVASQRENLFPSATKRQAESPVQSEAWSFSPTALPPFV